MNWSAEDILEKATIYRKQNVRPLSKDHIAMNAAAQEICSANPTMLVGKRKDLIEAASKKIMEEGFQFAKGKSRSKETSDEEDVALKRRKLSVDVRNSRRFAKPERQNWFQGTASPSG